MKPIIKKKHNPTPVFLIEQQQQSNTNSLLISKMLPNHKNHNSNMVFSGGFKQTNQSVISSSIGVPPEVPPPIQPSHLYQKLGVSLKPKYRPQPEDRQLGDDILEKMDVQLSRMKEQRWKNFSQISNGVYNIANDSNKVLSAIHVPSSLQVVNLQNVEAKLEAHRLKIKPIQQQYHKKKGKKGDSYLRYPESSLKFNINLDKQMQELDIQKGKIYELARKQQNKQPEQIDLDRLWEEKKKSNPKLAQYDVQYQQYLLQKDAKNLISSAVRQRLFTWDKYSQSYNDKKTHSNFKSSLHRSKTKSKEKPQRSIDSDQENYKISDLKQVLASKDDKFIASYIISKIDHQKKGLISKEEFYEFIKEHEQVLRGYQIDPKWLFTDLDSYQTQRKGMMNKLQIAKFLSILQKVVHPKIVLKQNDGKTILNKQNNKSKPFNSTFPINKHLFQKVFEGLDINDDRLLKRQQFIQTIYTDSECEKIIDKEAIKINIIDKNITYRQIIAWILDDYVNQRNQKLKKSKEYITFGRFCEYFEVPQSLDLRKLQKKKIKQPSTNQIQIFDILSQFIQILHDIASSIPRIYQDYLVSIDFVQACLKDPQIAVIGEELCRIESIQTKLPIQTIHSTLRRMLKQCDQYSTWEELRSYFTRRGRPLNWNYQLINKKKQIRQSKIRQKIKKVSLQDNDFKEFGSQRKKSVTKNRSFEKYTIPKPFNITDQNKKAKHTNQQPNKQIQQLRKQFKANPLNKEIFQPKPDLILGKKPKNQQQQPYYKYENYENDRIQRALKKAQEKYALQEQIRAIKQKTQVKARQIGIDLTKKYVDVIKEQKKQSKKKIDVKTPSVSKNLYPQNMEEQRKKKIEKAIKNIDKANSVEKRKKQMQDQIKQKAKEKNEGAYKLAQKKKKQEQEEDKQRRKMDKNNFKPNVKHRQLTQAQKKSIEQGKLAKETKKKEKQQQNLKYQQERRRKILQHQVKQKKLQINGLTDQQILQKLDEVDIEDLLLDQKDKRQYKKEYKSKATNRKQMKQKFEGIAGRERAAMEAEQKRIMQGRKKYKEQKQAQMIEAKKETSSQISTQKSHRNQLQFHRSKALRRYRAIMEGKQPLSEFDKYSTKGPKQNEGMKQQIEDDI